MEYKTVIQSALNGITGDTLGSGLEDKINRLLKEGWELYGNPILIENRTVFQSLIRKTDGKD